MDPISIAALVCGIVSAFTGAANLLKGRKKRKAAVALQNSLAVAPPQVQKEYDHDFSRTGPRFATGDDIGRSQLSAILINLQSEMIGTLQAIINGGSGSYTSLLGTSNSSRLDTIAALSTQFQRLSQNAPIQESITPASSKKCALWDDTNQGQLNMSCEGEEDGTNEHFIFEKGRSCTVYNEINSKYIWVRFTFSTAGWDSYTAYMIPKSALSREYIGPVPAVLNAACTGKRASGKCFTFAKGRDCIMYNDISATMVWVRFTFSDPAWDANEAYVVERRFLTKI